jgi:hypothetical protein
LPMYGANCNDLAAQWEKYEKVHGSGTSKEEGEADGKVDPSPCRQLYDYMCFTGSHFGILTTYLKTRLFVRDCWGNLVVVQSFESQVSFERIWSL